MPDSQKTENSIRRIEEILVEFSKIMQIIILCICSRFLNINTAFLEKF